MSEPPITQTSKLFDFSIEVFENIFQYLDSLGVLRVGLLSRQAHTFLLPYYFRRCNVKHSDDLSTVDSLSFDRDKMARTEDAFRAVRTSPMVTKVKHLRCIFNFPEHEFLWEIRSVYTVLLKLRNVEKIELNFAAIPDRLISHTIPRLKSMREWRYAMKIFMWTVLDKSPSSLSVLYPPDCLLDGPYGSDRGQLQVSFWRNLVSWESLAHRRRPTIVDKRPLLDRIFPAATRSHPPHSTSSGSLESLTSLQLGGNLRQEGWGRLASHFTLHSLASLTLDMKSQMGFKAILRFLERHPTISTLCLTNVNAEETYTTKPYIIADTFLPHLKELKAPVDVFLVLFGPHSAAKFGDLETVEVSEDLNPPSSDWESVARRLTRMASRLEGKDISLDLRELQRNLFPEQPCAILSESGIKVKELRLCVLGVAVESDDLVPWISSFTHLERLSIRSHDRPDVTPRSVTARFVQAVYAQHPKRLHSVTVEGELMPNLSREEHPVTLSTVRPQL